MMLWIIFSALALMAAVFVMLPLRANTKKTPGREAGSVSILADQLRELDADRERGLISEAEARAARVEIKRRLLAVSRSAKMGHVDAPGRGRILLVVAALTVPVAAGAFYALLGSPQTPSVAFADRQDERAQQAEIAELADRLLDRLKNDPAGGPTEGWVLLAQTYMRMGRYDDAVAALENVAEREGANAATQSQYAEALIAAEDGIVTPKARAAISRALDMDPTNPAATFYEALALDQAGDSHDAHDLLLARLEKASGAEPWVEALAAQANRIGERLGRDPVRMTPAAPAAGPTQADIAVASDMTEEERDAFIRSMVERLASRLESSPDDLDGWLRLANAYRVLGETDKAQDAYGQAARLARSLPEDDPRRQTIRRALAETEG